MNKIYINIIGAFGLFLATTGMAVDNTLHSTPLPTALVGSDMYKDGGTLRFDLLDAQGAPLSVFVDGRFDSPTPGTLYLNAYPKDSDNIIIPQDSALASAFLGVLRHWLNDNYTEEQQKHLPSASSKDLTQEDYQARWIMRVFERVEPKNDNQKAQQSGAGYPPQSVGSPDP